MAKSPKATEAESKPETAAQTAPEQEKPTEAESKPETAVQTAPEPEKLAEQEEESLYPLSFLDGRYRIPTWQAAALRRLKGWESGKKVTEDVYRIALEQLTKRRIGG